MKELLKKALIKFSMTRFDGEGGEGGAGSGGDGDQKAGGDKDNKAQPYAVFPDEKSFMGRVSREAKKLVGETLKEMGFESPDAARAAAAKIKDDTDKQKTDNQKLQEQLENEKKAKDSILATANARLIQAELRLQASGLGVPVDRMDALVKLTDASGITVDDNGAVLGTKEALEACLKANPFLKGAPGSVGSGTNPGAGGGVDEVADAKKLAESRNKAPEVTGFDPWAKK